jgi:hypothetical protein
MGDQIETYDAVYLPWGMPRMMAASMVLTPDAPGRLMQWEFSAGDDLVALLELLLEELMETNEYDG